MNIFVLDEWSYDDFIWLHDLTLVLNRESQYCYRKSQNHNGYHENILAAAVRSSVIM